MCEEMCGEWHEACNHTGKELAEMIRNLKGGKK
jgi:hypothetical protein